MHSLLAFPQYCGTPVDLPGSSAYLAVRAALNHPGSHCTLVRSLNYAQLPDFTRFGRLVTIIRLTRPNQVHLRCGSHIRFPRLRRRSCLWTSLVGYVSNEQITRLGHFTQQDRPGLSWRTETKPM